MEIQKVLETRANMYAFLSRMYLEEPPHKLVEDIVHKKFPLHPELPLNKELVEGFEILKKFMDGVVEGVDELYDELALSYAKLFIGPHKMLAPPYESLYRDKQMMGRSVLKAKKMYAKAGIGKTLGCPEPEDHVALELEFMRYLCEKEIKALENNEEITKYLMIQKEFLNECLLEWMPDFCTRILESNQSDFYKGIAKITEGFLFLDNAMIDELLEIA